MATITSGSRSGGGKTFTVGDTVYFTNYSTSLDGSAGSNSGYTMPWHGKITKLYDTTYTNWIYTQSNADAAGKTSSYAMLTRPSWCTKGYKITVTYNHYGGSGTTSQTGYVGASLTGTSSRTGYTFAGWFTSTASNASKVTTIPSSATTYYAHWTAKAITIAYNANGGSGTMTNSTGSYGTPITLRANTFTRSGYTFSGWATSATGAKVYNNQQSVTNINNGGTTTLYAVWVQSAATITFNSNGGQGEDYTQQVSQAIATQLSPNLFTKTGYHLLGWAEQSEGDIIYQDQGLITIPSGTSAKTLYAIWQINNYYINYIGNDNDYGFMRKQLCTYNTSTTLDLNNYRKRKKSFKHWAKLESFTKRISEEYSENNVTISYQLSDDEIFISASAGINQDGVDNPKGFNIIRGPFYNKQSRIVTVTGNGISSAEQKEFYLDIIIVDTSYTANLEITVSETPSEIVSFELKSENQTISFSELAPQDFTSTTINIELNYPSKYTTITCPTPEWAESINIISSGATYNTYTDQATIFNLTEQSEGEINLYAIWQNGQPKHKRIFNDILFYIGQHFYPKNSIFITQTNQNPSSFLKGEWELIRKEFIPKTVTDAITFNATNTTSGSSVIEIYPGSINIRASWMPKVAYADSTLEVGTINLSKIGLTKNFLVSEVGVGDALNSAFLLYINGSGVIQAVQVVPATNATSIAASSSSYIYVNSFMMFRNPDDMLDSFCNKFYWKRIK